MNTRNLLERTGRAIARHPRPVLAAAVLATALGLLAATRLGVETDIAQMLPADNAAARSFTAISDLFRTTSVLAVVVEGADREATIDAAEGFAERIKSDPRTASLVRSVRLKVDRDFVDHWGFMLQDEEDLADNERVLRTTRLVPLLSAVNDLMEERLSDGDDEEVRGNEGEDDATALMTRFALFAKGLRKMVERPDGADREAAADELAETFLIGDRYYFDPEGRTLLMTVSPTFDLGDREKLVALIKGARAVAKDIGRGAGTFSFAGDVASEADEEEAISADIFYPSLISIAVILVLFFFSFNRLRSILFATAALVVGLIADLGFAALSVKNLNMVTSSFGALLVGLGIDFGIHVAANYDEAVHRGATAEEAMAETFGGVVLPVAIGALTTAAAFYSLVLSRTVAFSQFGIIAGTGILTTLLASVTVLPALLVAFPGPRGIDRVGAPRFARGRPVFAFAAVSRCAAASARHRAAVILIAVLATGVAVFFIPKNKFEYDMRRIGPQGTAAQRTETVIGERFGISTYQALATAADLESVRSLAELMKDAPFIRRVESLADYVPSPDEQEGRRAAIAAIAANGDRVVPFRWDADAVSALTAEIERLEMNVIELGDLAAASLGEDSLPVRARTATIREIYGAERGASGEEVYARLVASLTAESPAIMAARLSAVDEAFASALDRRIGLMASVDRPLIETDVPADILTDFRSADGGTYLVVAQPARGLEGNESIRRFSDGLSAITPTATGSLILGVELSREVLGEARVFAVVVGALILVLVGISFRSLAALISASIPFLMGFSWTFGLYPAFGRFNIVNALALPLILGIGIDYAVHFLTALRDARKENDGELDVETALARTGKAVALSALTTMIGFGSLAFAGRFRGIADLGMTLLIGIGCNFLAAAFVLPAIESLSRKKRRFRALEGANRENKEAI